MGVFLPSCSEIVGTGRGSYVAMGIALELALCVSFVLASAFLDFFSSLATLRDSIRASFS